MNLFTSLRYLAALHQHKHFGRAAEACHISQPALSNAIRALEEEFDTGIVKRGHAFQSFTPEGERIFVSAQRMLHEQELLEQDLKSAAGRPAGSLTLAAVPTVMPMAARFAGILQARHPGLIVVLWAMSSSDIEAGLEDLSIDLGFGFTDRLQAKVAKLTTVHQYTERYFLLRRTDPPAKKSLRSKSRPMSWQDAAQLPLCLLTPDMHNRAIIEDAFRQAGIVIKPVIETNSILGLGMAVLAGEVSSILPGALVDVLSGYSELEAVPLHAPQVLTPIGFMYAFNDRPSHALRAALNMASEPTWLRHMASHSGVPPPKLPKRQSTAQ